jgi:ABC-2 type transport system permease protein
MSPRALIAIVRKEFRQVRRDPTSLGMLLVLPSALIVLVGYALNFDVKHIPLVLYDQDNSAQSRELLRVFRQTEYFDCFASVDSYREVERLLNMGDADAAVVVPVNFARDLAAGLDVRVQVLVDGSDANSAGQAISYASRMMADYSTRVVSEAMIRRGRKPFVPIDFRPRVWYNPDLVSSKYLVPGLIGFILVLTAVVSTSMTVVREKERGTMEQILVSPVRPLELILGKTIPYLVISLVAATAILALGYLLFDVVILGSIALLYVAIFILIIGALAQGLLISTVTDSQQVAFMISVFSSLLPSFLLSGFIFPIANMPWLLQVLSNLAVAKFFLVICRGIILKGTGLETLWAQFVFMLLFALVFLGVSARRMSTGGSG